jgi:ATP-dependent Zn protease
MIFTFRRVFFILCLLFLAVMVWRLLTVSRPAQTQFSYPAFVQTLDTGKIQKATIFMGFDLADLQLTMRDSSRAFVNGVPTKDLPTVIKRMMDAGVSVEFGRARRFESAEFLFDTVPFALLLVAVVYITYLRRKTKA